MNEKIKTNPWLPWPSTNLDAPLRLFCFPYAGGGASIFRSWSQVLPPEIDVRPVQLPGRERRLAEDPYDHITSLVTDAASALLPSLTEPFAFFGHCLGALVAFELSRQIWTMYGIQPTALFVSGHRAPHLPDRLAPAHQLLDAEFVAELRRRNGTREEVFENPALLRLLLPLLRADFTVCETYLYTPGKMLDCPITTFGGTHDAAVLPEELYGWSELTNGSCTVQILPGDHFFLHTAQPQLLQILSQNLAHLVPCQTSFEGQAPPSSVSKEEQSCLSLIQASSPDNAS